jgi:hypothetical protein
MIYQLPNGKVINISIDEFLNMSDTDLQDLNGFNIGEYVTNPFSASVLENPEAEDKDLNFDFNFMLDEFKDPLDDIDLNNEINNLLEE